MTAVTLIELLPSEYVDVFCSVLSRGSVKTSLLGMTCPEITSFFTNCFSKFYKGDQKGLIVYIVCTLVYVFIYRESRVNGDEKSVAAGQIEEIKFFHRSHLTGEIPEK